MARTLKDRQNPALGGKRLRRKAQDTPRTDSRELNPQSLPSHLHKEPKLA
jgi:hypothetical protein